MTSISFADLNSLPSPQVSATLSQDFLLGDSQLTF